MRVERYVVETCSEQPGRILRVEGQLLKNLINEHPASHCYATKTNQPRENHLFFRYYIYTIYIYKDLTSTKLYSTSCPKDRKLQEGERISRALQ